METILHQVGFLSFHHTKISTSASAPAPPPPWLKSNNSNNLIHRIPLRLQLANKTRTQLQAQGRGFGISVPDKKKARPEEGESAQNDDDDAIPQVVFDRMIRRVVFAVGSPMALGLGLLYVQSVLKKSELSEVPGWLPFLTILLSFGTSAVGIAYGTLSTSMDPDKEGSFLGWVEAQKNWPELWRDEDDKR